MVVARKATVVLVGATDRSKDTAAMVAAEGVEGQDLVMVPEAGVDLVLKRRVAELWLLLTRWT